MVILRHRQPERPRSFRVPFSPVMPAVSVVCCLILMLGLPLETWIRFVGWLVVGLVIYGIYSRKRSPLHQAVAAIPASGSTTH